MPNSIDLTNGKINSKLIKLALPIMGTAFIQMAYNMIDMMWVGKDGSKAVAAVGTAAFYPWLATAFVMLSKVGGEVKVAQSVGQNNKEKAKSFIKAAIELNITLALIYTIITVTFNKQLIDIFKLGEIEVYNMSRQYLIIVGLGMIFYFINPLLTSIYNGLGNSKSPFLINTIGLVVNIILDPVLIFGFGFIKPLGVVGAALATIIAEAVVTVVFIIMIVKNKNEYFKNKYFRNINFEFVKSILKIGFPIALQSGLFTVFSMTIGVIVASFGSVAIAVQKVGSQIEAISWMTADGFATSLSTFVGQNYGAKKFDRIHKGCKAMIITAIMWGIITTLALVLFNEPLFKLFINESDAIEKGRDYLTILGYSQLFMCIEITTTAIFKGIGRTYIPSSISIIFTGARIPMAMVLSSATLLGLNGIWWSISLSSVIKGVLLIGIFVILVKSKKLYKEDVELRVS